MASTLRYLDKCENHFLLATAYAALAELLAPSAGETRHGGAGVSGDADAACSEGRSDARRMNGVTKLTELTEFFMRKSRQRSAEGHALNVRMPAIRETSILSTICIPKIP